MIAGLVIAALLLFIAWQNYRWDQERSDLLQRIQAPERAIVEHGEHKPTFSPPPVLTDEEYEMELERRESEARS